MMLLLSPTLIINVQGCTHNEKVTSFLLSGLCVMYTLQQETKKHFHDATVSSKINGTFNKHIHLYINK